MNRVAMALLIDYSSVYYIDLNTDHYEQYGTNTGYQKLKLQIMGVKNIDTEIRKDNEIKQVLEENAVFSQIAESLAKQYDTIYYVGMFGRSLSGVLFN